MAPQALGVFLLCAFAAEVIGTVAGFGAATVLTPIASFFMEIKTAVAVVACFHVFGNAWRLYFFWRAVNWRLVGQFGVAAVGCSFVGAQTAAWMPAEAVRLLLGAFLVLYVVLEARAVTAVRLPATPGTLLAGGVVSGLIAGIIGTGGAVRAMCLLAFGLPREAYLGTSAMIALLVDLTRLPVYLSQEFLPASMCVITLSLVAVAFAGAWLGQRLVRWVSPRQFTRIVLVMLGLMGVKLLLDGLRP